ncbi:hypothetical protein [Microbacterium gorillae]|uniref:hypothetical protein n=1 Tax=Microbacterium gorillae TaxID=1231063 RepID=UPI00058C0CE5|nr:hypothetical protein [Microbacterium gorillae]
MNLRRRTLPLILAAAAVALVGCATPIAGGAGSATGGTTPDPTSTPSTSSVTVSVDQVQVSWLTTTSMVVILPAGSCPLHIGDIVAGTQKLTVTFAAKSGASCAPTTAAQKYVLGVPAGVDTTKDLAVTIVTPEGKTDVTLSGLAGGEVIPEDRSIAPEPAASWVGPHTLAVLTYGSSSCAPTGGAVADGVLTLKDPPADTACTMDLAPRVTLIDAPDVAHDAKLTLAGSTTSGGSPVTLQPLDATK